MRKSRNSILIVFLFALPFLTQSQDWVRIYGQGLNADGRYVIPDYDKGFVFLGDINYAYSWVFKTDVNGNILWNKKFGNNSYTVWSSNIEKTIDGGSILCGTFTKYSSSFDAFIMKLNSCGEIEWCKDLYTPSNYDMGLKVKQTPEGNYILLGGYFVTNPYSNVSLFKFSSAGDLIWHQYYPLDSLYYDDQPQDLLVDGDGYLITSARYYPDPGQSGGGVLRTNFIKTDTAGFQSWNTVYVTNGYYYSQPWATKKNKFGNYYSGITHTDYNQGDNPAIIKVLHSGQQSYNHNVIDIDNFHLSGLSTIDFLNDTNLILGYAWTIDNIWSIGFVKTDTFGILRKTKFLSSIFYSPTSTAHSQDNKFLTIASGTIGGDWAIGAFKVNSDLDYDSIYTHPFIYDSLCPHPIISDTINPECDNTIVDVNEPFSSPETVNIKVCPNPAEDHVFIEFPKYLSVSTGTAKIPAITVYYQWKSTILEVYNIEGHKILEKDIPKSQAQMELNVSSWPQGMYFFKLNYNGKPVGDARVIIK
jgi:hypothetical protein